jgi:hypothetical protein
MYRIYIYIYDNYIVIKNYLLLTLKFSFKFRTIEFTKKIKKYKQQYLV